MNRCFQALFLGVFLPTLSLCALEAETDRNDTVRPMTSDQLREQRYQAWGAYDLFKEIDRNNGKFPQILPTLPESNMGKTSQGAAWLTIEKDSGKLMVRSPFKQTVEQPLSTWLDYKPLRELSATRDEILNPENYVSIHLLASVDRSYITRDGYILMNKRFHTLPQILPTLPESNISKACKGATWLAGASLFERLAKKGKEKSYEQQALIQKTQAGLTREALRTYTKLTQDNATQDSKPAAAKDSTGPPLQQQLFRHHDKLDLFNKIRQRSVAAYTIAAGFALAKITAIRI